METPALDTEVRVMFFDTDAGGVVHNIAYLRFIETNRSLLAEKMGYPLAEMLGRGNCPVVVRTEIDYRRPARLWDTLFIHGELEISRTKPVLVCIHDHSAERRPTSGDLSTNAGRGSSPKVKGSAFASSLGNRFWPSQGK